MDVWMTWCKRKASCRYCEQPISKATPMVVGKIWRKGDNSSRKFNIKLYWHPECWVKNGLDYLRMHPYSHGKHATKRLGLLPEELVERNKLLRRYGSAKSRLGKLTNSSGDVLRVIRLETRMKSIMAEISQLGGIPKGWKNVSTTGSETLM